MVKPTMTEPINEPMSTITLKTAPLSTVLSRWKRQT
jgi:hypothetical protein